jgi:hypothetical protein
MIATAGFDDVAEHGRYTLVLEGKLKIPHVVIHATGVAPRVESNGAAPGSPVPGRPV